MKMVSVPCLMVALLTSLLIVPEVQPSPAASSRCLRSCVRCKEMFGQFFLGHVCARTCLQTHQHFKVVCTDIDSVKPFLDINSLMDYEYYDEEMQ